MVPKATASTDFATTALLLHRPGRRGSFFGEGAPCGSISLLPAGVLPRRVHSAGDFLSMAVCKHDMLTEVNNNSLGYRVYGKLFEQMYDGTLATKGPWQALVTFQQIIILADRNGEVDMTPEAIARRTTIPLEIIYEGLQALQQPDSESRSPALEGRRIVPLSEDRAWGWRIVNYLHYRRIRSQEERREYMRSYQQKRREAVKQNVNKSTGGKQNQPIAVSSKQYAVKNKPLVAPLALPGWLNAETWNAYVTIRPARARNRESLKAALGKLEKFREQGFDPNEIVATSLANGWQLLKEPDAKRGQLPARISTCGNCGAALSGAWVQSPKGRVCNACHGGYLNGAWPIAG